MTIENVLTTTTFKDAHHLTAIIIHLSSGKIVHKKFRKMFSKFKIEKPQQVLNKRGPRYFEAEQSIISLPLLEACDACIRSLRAENDELRANNEEYRKLVSLTDTELTRKRVEVFQLTQELQLLREEVGRSRLAVNPVKNTVKFNASRKSYWDVDKSSRCSKRKKLKEYFQNVTEVLPAEFKPVEVCAIAKPVKLLRFTKSHI